MSPDDIRERGLWPKGFLPSPHPFHPTGGFVFPQMEIDAMKRQDARHHQRHVRDRDHLGPVRSHSTTRSRSRPSARFWRRLGKPAK